jgi:hypothetical protein
MLEPQNHESSLPTPFSPCSFDYYPGSNDQTSQHTEVKQTFRFAPGPDGPLPSIPSGEDSDESEPEVIVRKRFPDHQKRSAGKVIKEKKTWLDFPFCGLLATLLCTIGGIMFSVAIHKVIIDIFNGNGQNTAVKMFNISGHGFNLGHITRSYAHIL